MSGPPRLGGRGGGWVALQLAALAGTVAAGSLGGGWPQRGAPERELLGAILLGGGILLLSLGAAALGRSLTPYPAPAAGASLRRDGVYGRVRHPIYGGLIGLALGWSLLSAPLALAPAALLVAVLELKSRAEEALLAERFCDYDDYRAATPARFLPRPFPLRRRGPG